MFRQLVVGILDRVPAHLAASIKPASAPARLLAPIVNRLVPDTPRLVTVRSGPGAGLRLMIEPRSEKYYWTGMHEPHVQDAVVASLSRGGVFWDVGAHIGFMTLLAARAVGDTGKVVSFEPMPATRERLQASVSAEGLTNVTIKPLAISHNGGTRTLHAADASLMWSLDPDRGGQGGIPVTCSTLDTVLASCPVPDMIKIDAEGVEVDVLRGGQKLIEQHRPTLLVEFSTAAMLNEGRELLGDSYRWTHLGANHWLLSPSPTT